MSWRSPRWTHFSSIGNTSTTSTAVVNIVAIVVLLLCRCVFCTHGFAAGVVGRGASSPILTTRRSGGWWRKSRNAGKGSERVADGLSTASSSSSLSSSSEAQGEGEVGGVVIVVVADADGEDEEEEYQDGDVGVPSMISSSSSYLSMLSSTTLPEGVRRRLQRQSSKDELSSLLVEYLGTPLLDSSSLFSTLPSTTRLEPPLLDLSYGIFRGRSSLRGSSGDDEGEGGGDESKLPLLENCVFRGAGDDRDEGDDPSELIISKTALAALVLLSSSSSSSSVGDVAHEVVLGVRTDNVHEAEYAATHPGRTDWMKRHPLSTSDDVLHSVIHRYEGGLIGEGNHTGYDNAKYWIAGGPKNLTVIERAGEGRETNATTKTTINKDTCREVVFAAMAEYARSRAPLCVEAGVIAAPTASASPPTASTGGDRNRHQHVAHSIIAAGNTRRSVLVPAGCWDPFRFIDLLRQLDGEVHSERVDDVSRHGRDANGSENEVLLRRQLRDLNRLELHLLLRYEFMIRQLKCRRRGRRRQSYNHI